MEAGSVVRAVFEFLPSVSEELPLFTGDVIEVLSVVDEFWLLGNKDGVTGKIPGSLLQYMSCKSLDISVKTLHLCTTKQFSLKLHGVGCEVGCACVSSYRCFTQICFKA